MSDCKFSARKTNDEEIEFCWKHDQPAVFCDYERVRDSNHVLNSKLTTLTQERDEARARLGEYEKLVDDFTDSIETKDDCESPTCGHGRVCGFCQWVAEIYSRFLALRAPSADGECECKKAWANGGDEIHRDGCRARQ